MRRVQVFVVLAFAFGAEMSLAKNVYVSQNAAGGNTGADCADAHPASWFNTATNWGAGSAQIGAGDTVHLCGAFNGVAGQNMLTTQGSGISGKPITILFEPGASLSAPYWDGTNGAIHINGQSYIVVDGGTNGTIRNTQNGTALTYQQTSRGVQIDNGNNVTVQNVIVTNFYVRTEDSTDSTDVICIGAGGASDYITYQNNTLDHCRIGFAFTNDTASSTHGNLVIRNNTETFWEHGITIASSATNGIVSGVTVSGNSLGGGSYLWDSGSANMWHHDGIHMFSQVSGSSVNNVQIYNNYFYGIWSRDAGYAASHITAAIFLEQIGSGSLMFNNVIDFSQGGALNQPTNGYIMCKGSGSNNCGMYNNTFYGISDYAQAFSCSSNSGHIFQNNVAYQTDGMYAPSGCTIAASNNNVFYGTTGWTQNGSMLNSLSAWRSTTGFDGNSVAVNPLMTLGTYSLTTGSPAIGLGANLTSLGIAALMQDKNGVARPTSGAWDSGAIQSQGTSATLIPPTSISLAIQ